MNILQLCLSSGLGGLELYVYRASDALQGHHKITAVLQQGSKLDDYYREHSSIKRLHLKRRSGPLPIINAWKLARIIDEVEINRYFLTAVEIRSKSASIFLANNPEAKSLSITASMPRQETIWFADYWDATPTNRNNDKILIDQILDSIDLNDLNWFWRWTTRLQPRPASSTNACPSAMRCLATSSSKKEPIGLDGFLKSWIVGTYFNLGHDSNCISL